MAPSYGDARGVLIVEDEVMIAILLKSVLEDAGIPVSGVAHSAVEALDLARAIRPKTALIDIRLGPGPDGIQVAERLLDAYGCKTVFASGSGERETVERANRVPGSMFLQKPVDPKRLVRCIRDAMAAG